MATTYVAASAFLLALVGSYLITPVTSRLARRFGVLDYPSPGTYKKHRAATPYLGGVAIVSGLLIGASLLVLPSLGDTGAVIRDFAIVILGALFLAVVGFVDDIRPIPRSVRLSAQAVTAGVAWLVGFRVSLIGADFVDFLLTAFWIIGITNAFNLLDNMDGLTSGLAGIAALVFGTMGILGDMDTLATVSMALAGASLGFLVHNRHPARSFMGDAGSTFLGFLLAVIGIELRFDNLPEVTFLVPVVVLGLPILDTTLVLVSRKIHKRPLFLGGRDHISHRLVHSGLSVPVAVGVLYWAGACLGWLGIVISRSTVQVGWMLLGFVISLGIFFAAVLLRISVYGGEESNQELLATQDRGGSAYTDAIDNASERVVRGQGV